MVGGFSYLVVMPQWTQSYGRWILIWSGCHSGHIHMLGGFSSGQGAKVDTIMVGGFTSGQGATVDTIMIGGFSSGQCATMDTIIW